MRNVIAFVLSLCVAASAQAFGDETNEANAGAIAGAAALAGAQAGAVAGAANHTKVGVGIYSPQHQYGKVDGDFDNRDYNANIGIQKGYFDNADKFYGSNKQGQGQGQQQGQINHQGQSNHQGQYGYQDSEQDNDQKTVVNVGGDTQTIKHRKIPAASAAPVAASACSSGVSGQGRAGGASLAMTNPLCNLALVAETAKSMGQTEVADQAVALMLKEVQAQNNIWRRGTRHLPVVGGFLRPLF